MQRYNEPAEAVLKREGATYDSLHPDFLPLLMQFFDENNISFEAAKLLAEEGIFGTFFLNTVMAISAFSSNIADEIDKEISSINDLDSGYLCPAYSASTAQHRQISSAIFEGNHNHPNLERRSHMPYYTTKANFATNLFQDFSERLNAGLQEYPLVFVGNGPANRMLIYSLIELGLASKEDIVIIDPSTNLGVYGSHNSKNGRTNPQSIIFLGRELKGVHSEYRNADLGFLVDQVTDTSVENNIAKVLENIKSAELELTQGYTQIYELLQQYEPHLVEQFFEALDGIGHIQGIQDFFDRLDNLSECYTLPVPIKAKVAHISKDGKNALVLYEGGQIEASAVIFAPGMGPPNTPNKFYSFADRHDMGQRSQIFIDKKLADEYNGKNIVLFGTGQSTAEMMWQFEYWNSKGYNIEYTVITHKAKDEIFRNVEESLDMFPHDIPRYAIALKRAEEKNRIKYNAQSDIKGKKITVQHGEKQEFIIADEIFTLTGYEYPDEYFIKMGLADNGVMQPRYSGQLLHFQNVFLNGAVRAREGIKNKSTMPGFMQTTASLAFILGMKLIEKAYIREKVYA